MRSIAGAKNPFPFTRLKDAAAVLAWLLLTLPVNNATATETGAGLPRNVCHDTCGPRQHTIWTRFERGEGLNLAALPGVYAGVCHVLGDRIDPDREHHVGFLLARDADRYQLHLRFSFFTDLQPYDELDAAQAMKVFGVPVLPLTVHDEYAYAEVSSRRFFARYWLRRGRDSERVLLVSYFGDQISILCDAGANR